MMPSTGTLVLPNRSIARVASISDRSCGVETITAPSGRAFWTSDSCTSPVPGGRSTRIISASPQSPSISWVSAPDAIGPRHASACPAGTSCPTDSSLHALRLDRDQLLASRPAAARGCRAGSAATGRKCRRRSCRRCLPIRASATARLAASVDLPTPPLPDPIAMIVPLGPRRGQRDPRLARRRAWPAPPPSAAPRARRARRGRARSRRRRARRCCPSACASGSARRRAGSSEGGKRVVVCHAPRP